jgi:hypothetical protein
MASHFPRSPLKPEELPVAVTLQSAFGSYNRVFTFDGLAVTCVRRVELKQGVVPITEYDPLKKFLSDVGKADRASMLLRKQT